NAKLKMTTTSRAKNSMEFSTSRERHSNRRSLVTLAQVKAAMEFMRSLHSCGHPGRRAAAHKLSTGEKQELIGYVGQQSQLMGDQENCRACGAHHSQQFGYLIGRFGIDVGKRFIKQQQ